MYRTDLEELHRLRVHLEAAERRVHEAEMAVSRIMEELREAKLSIIMLTESAKTVQEFGAETEGPQHWVVGGLPS
jgi:hypothetical protein